MNKITFIVPGEPIAQPRHRVAKGGAYIKKDHPIHKWKADIASQTLLDGYANKKIEDPVKLKAIFKMPIPENRKKTASENTPHIIKPDIDNLLKAVMDVLTQTGVFKDDNIVYDINASKVYSTEPGVYVEIAW